MSWGGISFFQAIFPGVEPVAWSPLIKNSRVCKEATFCRSGGEWGVERPGMLSGGLDRDGRISYTYV